MNLFYTFIILILIGFSCQNEKSTITKTENINNTIKPNKNSSYWYWIDKKLCFPNYNYCVDSLLIHYDSISENITLDNIDDYIPDSITKIVKTQNILPTKFNDNKEFVFNNFILMTQLIKNLNNAFDHRKISTKYKNTFPVSLKYFFYLNKEESIILTDTLIYKTFKKDMLHRENIKVKGQIYIHKITDIPLNLIVIKQTKVNMGIKLYFYNNNETKENLVFELSLIPIDKSKNLVF